MKRENVILWALVVLAMLGIVALCATPWIGRGVYGLVGGPDVEQWTNVGTRHAFAAMVVTVLWGCGSCVLFAGSLMWWAKTRQEFNEQRENVRRTLIYREPPGTPAPPPVKAHAPAADGLSCREHFMAHGECLMCRVMGCAWCTLWRREKTPRGEAPCGGTQGEEEMGAGSH